MRRKSTDCLRLVMLCVLVSTVAVLESDSGAGDASGESTDTIREADFRRFWDNTRRMGPKPSAEVVERIVSRARKSPDDAEALYWAAQAQFSRLTDKVPDCMELLRISAEKGCPMAMTSYGVALVDGSMIKQDVGAGLKWLAAAKKRNDASAYFQLGIISVKGVDGMPRDMDRAEALLLGSVERGMTRGLAQLARLYNAKGNYDRALEFTKRAAKAGDPEMIEMLVNIYAGKTNVPISDAAKGTAEAIEWARRGALLNHPRLLAVYGFMLTNRFPSLEQDPLLSLRLLQRAADLGDTDAAVGLEAGRVIGLFGDPPAPAEGIRGLEQLAAKGVVDAKWHLGRIIYDGLNGAVGVPVDRDRALRLIREAAKSGHPDATAFLKGAEDEK